jgi:hypothetical protein
MPGSESLIHLEQPRSQSKTKTLLELSAKHVNEQVWTTSTPSNKMDKPTFLSDLLDQLNAMGTAIFGRMIWTFLHLKNATPSPAPAPQTTTCLMIPT